MQIKIGITLVALIAIFFGCAKSPQSIEENLLLTYRDILLEGSTTGNDSRVVNVVIIGLSKENNERIRKLFFRPDPKSRVTLVDATLVEEREPFRTINGEDFANEAKIEILEWIDERTVIIKSSNHFHPLIGGGGTTKIQFDGSEWKEVETLDSWIS